MSEAGVEDERDDRDPSPGAAGRDGNPRGRAVLVIRVDLRRQVRVKGAEHDIAGAELVAAAPVGVASSA